MNHAADVLGITRPESHEAAITHLLTNGTSALGYAARRMSQPLNDMRAVDPVRVGGRIARYLPDMGGEARVSNLVFCDTWPR